MKIIHLAQKICTSKLVAYTETKCIIQCQKSNTNFYRLSHMFNCHHNSLKDYRKFCVNEMGGLELNEGLRMRRILLEGQILSLSR